MSEGALAVREMRLDEVDIRIGYFHAARDEDLVRMGVDRARLPTPEAWRAAYAEELARAEDERTSYQLVWLVDDGVVGFSTMDRITLGESGFMHLHILQAGQRHQGLGAPL